MQLVVKVRCCLLKRREAERRVAERGDGITREAAENGETEEDNRGTSGIKEVREEKRVEDSRKEKHKMIEGVEGGLCWKRSGQIYKQEIKHKRQRESGRQRRETSEDRVKVCVCVCWGSARIDKRVHESCRF